MMRFRFTQITKIPNAGEAGAASSYGDLARPPASPKHILTLAPQVGGLDVFGHEARGDLYVGNPAMRGCGSVILFER